VPDGFNINQIHGRVYGVIRDATERFARRSGWKKNVPWLVSALGEAIGVSHAFVYKNYPDRNDVLTAVRVYRWSNPLHLSTVQLSESRVSRYEGPYLEYLEEELSQGRPVLCTARNPLPPLRDYMAAGGIERIVVVPVFAGSEWWGFLGIESASSSSTGEPFSIDSIADILRTLAVVLGESIRGAGLDQALRWSERLQRVQRDIALTVTRVADRTESLNELLELICELGEFDAAAIDIGSEAGTRLAAIGDTPQSGAAGWCESCRPSFHDDHPEPVYGDSTMLEFCESTCPVRAAGFHSYAVIPVIYQGDAAASLALFSSRRSVVPTAVQRSIEAIATEIGMIIATVRSEAAGSGRKT